jgi:hypothetical protein
MSDLWRVEENLSSGWSAKTGKLRGGKPDWFYVGIYVAANADAAMRKARKVNADAWRRLSPELRAVPSDETQRPYAE